MIIYTSGTTGKPKGVVSTHAMIEAQIRTMIEPWGWSSSDHILNVLPLHHVHGVINVLACGLWAGATITMLPKFDAGTVWKHFRSAANLNLFMAVPTVYSKLISAYDAVRAGLFQSFFSLLLMEFPIFCSTR
jgi:malonyl-CoA/methylmalonyl-CoA synthetase